MAKTLSAYDRAWQTRPSNVLLLGFVLLMLALILTLFTSYTHNLDEIKPTLQFMFLPIGFVALFVILMRGEAAPIPPLVWIPAVGFFAVSLISTLTTYHPWRAWFTLGWYYSASLPFFVIPACIKDARTFRRFVLGYLAVGLGLIVFGLFHYFGGFDVLLEMLYPFGPPQLNRRAFDLMYTMAKNPEMFSTILNSDFYAAYLVILFPLGMNLVMAPFRRWWEPVMGLAIVFLGGVSIILSESNDSMGVTALIVAFYLVMASTIGHALWKNQRLLWTVVSGGVILVLTILVLMWGKLMDLWSTLPSAWAARKILWAPAWKMFLDDPILGAGPGGYFVRVPKYLAGNYYENEIANVNFYAHNQYLDVLCEQGVLGLACFLAILIATLGLGLRQIVRPGDDRLRIYQIGLVAGILGVSIQDFFSPNFRWTVCGVNHWAQLGLSISCAMLGLRAEERQAGASPAPGPSPAPPLPPRSSFWLRGFSESWNRRVGMAGALVSLPIALLTLVFGVHYFASAYYNNEGIMKLSTAEALAPSDPARAQLYYQRSIDDFDKAIARWPGFVTSYYKQAHAYSMLGRYDKALAAYDALSQYAPAYSETPLNYGIVHRVLADRATNPEEMMQHVRKAMAAYEEAISMSDKLRTRLAAADFYKMAARLDTAPPEEKRQWTHRWLELMHGTCMRTYVLTDERQDQVNVRRNMLTELLQQADAAQRDNNSERETLYLQWARDIADKLTEENQVGDERVIAMKVETLRRLGEEPQARAFLEKKLSEHPGSFSLNRLLAAHYVQSNQHAQASRQYERLARLTRQFQALMLKPGTADIARQALTLERDTLSEGRYLIRAGEQDRKSVV